MSLIDASSSKKFSPHAKKLVSYLKYLSVFIGSGSLKVLTWDVKFHELTSKCWNFHDFSSECILSDTSFSEEFDSISESSITISSLRNVTAKKQIICKAIKSQIKIVILSNSRSKLPESKELKGIYISLAFRFFGTFSDKTCWKSCQNLGLNYMTLLSDCCWGIEANDLKWRPRA